MNALNTPGSEITWNGPYHSVSSTQFGLESSTVCDKEHKSERCRKCKEIAMPAHVTDAGKKGALAVWCEAHCPRCLEFRRMHQGQSTQAPAIG